MRIRWNSQLNVWQVVILNKNGTPEPIANSTKLEVLTRKFPEAEVETANR